MTQARRESARLAAGARCRLDAFTTFLASLRTELRQRQNIESSRGRHSGSCYRSISWHLVKPKVLPALPGVAAKLSQRKTERHVISGGDVAVGPARPGWCGSCKPGRYVAGVDLFLGSRACSPADRKFESAVKDSGISCTCRAGSDRSVGCIQTTPPREASEGSENDQP
jgi:hypothetical protein